MPNPPLRALIVEDSEDDTLLLVNQLRQGGFVPEYTRVETGGAMRQCLEQGAWDIVLADFTMPQFDAFKALELLRASGLDLPFIIVSGTIGEERAVQAMKAGAHDYIMRSNTARLLPAVERELREAQVRLERRQAQERVQYLAYYDALTDLPNRTLFADRLRQAVRIGQREKQQFALLVMDLDRFKNINDTLGHHAGDQALQEAATRIKACMRESDTLARMGGDEFAILLPTTTHLNGAATVARKILATFAKPIQIGDRRFDIGASLGIALFPEHGNETDPLMRAADAAMYEAKRAEGGSRTYSPTLDLKSGSS